MGRTEVYRVVAGKLRRVPESSGMPNWELYYHFVWATHRRVPVIDATAVGHLYNYIKRKITSYQGAVLAIGGMPDHVHLIASLPPKVAPAAFIGAVKGSSSRYLSQASSAFEGFRWQTEYSVLSVSHQLLSSVVLYVERQQEHHTSGELDPKLEPPTDRDDS